MWIRVKNVTLKVLFMGALCVVGVLCLQLLRAQEAPPSELTVAQRVDLYVSQLQSQDASARQDAAAELGKIGPDAAAAVPALISAQSDPDVKVRLKATTALGDIGVLNDDVVNSMRQRLEDPSIFVRLAVVQAEGKLRAANNLPLQIPREP